MSDHFDDSRLVELQARALALPGVTETGACVKRSFKAGTRSFLFLGEKTQEINMMVKLADSMPTAQQMANDMPGVVAVGKSGWVTVKLGPEDQIAQETLATWLDESYRLQAPKKLLAQLD